MPIHTKKKVCIVCSEGPGEDKLFIVDLEWESGDKCVDDDVLSIPMKPTVCFDTNGLYLPSYCVLGSTLYVFVGYDPYNHEGGRSMYTYQLCDGISDLELTKSMLSEGPSMNEVKYFPKACPTPMGKILVISTMFNILDTDRCDIELYDPKDGKWQKLPSLIPSLPKSLPPYGDGRRSSLFLVRAFTFMKRDVLFLHTDVGCFSRDITSPVTVKWEEHVFATGSCASFHLYAGTSLVFIGGGDICMFPYSAFDIEHSDLLYNFPLLSSFPDSTHSYETGGIIPLENPEVTDTPHICLLHSAKNKKTGCHEILLQVYRCNLRECRKILKERRKKKPFTRKREGFVVPGTTKIKSIKIPVDVGVYVEPFNGSYLCSFTYIPSEFADPSWMITHSKSRKKSKKMRIQF